MDYKTTMRDLLVSGTESGFGRYLCEELGGHEITRENKDRKIQELRIREVDLIIHCAHPSDRRVMSDQISKYMDDTVFLTKELLSVPHNYFIYVSSIDIYPKNDKEHFEDELIDLSEVDTIYGVTKLMSESLVRKKGSNHLIIRPSGLLGRYTKKNNLLRLLDDESPNLTLTGDSEINLVTYKTVLDFINSARKEELSGVYNICSSGNVSLMEIAEMVNKGVSFGNYKYDPTNVNNDRASCIVPALKSSSRDSVLEYINGQDS
ncbi:MAG: NAD(P)-dependent oxidoreductase [Nanoarchaeota archaeon]|nr:NAD(P)-dependent oxidoreductase [Nanoarchaeota archaeon]